MTSEKKQPETGFRFSGCFCALFILFKHGQHIAITLRKRTRTPNLAVFALFAGVGRMRSGRSIQQKYRIFVAVSPLHRAAGGSAGTDKPAFVGTAVVKQYGAIIFGMNVRFHRLPFICYTITLNHSNARLASRYIRIPHALFAAGITELATRICQSVKKAFTPMPFQAAIGCRTRGQPVSALPAQNLSALSFSQAATGRHRQTA